MLPTVTVSVDAPPMRTAQEHPSVPFATPTSAHVAALPSAAAHEPVPSLALLESGHLVATAEAPAATIAALTNPLPQPHSHSV